MGTYLLGFRCSQCGASYDAEAATYACPHDGANLDAEYDYAAITRDVSPLGFATSRDRSIWHYGPLLPASMPSRVLGTPLATTGWSPLYRAPRLENLLGIRAVWLKDDTRLPSSSFKDRASAMVIARAMQTSIHAICAASTGNAASSLATLSAGTDLQSIIFVPASVPAGKLAQILIHGARVFAVKGSYDDAFDLALLASREFGWYNRNTGYNPYTREGKKTAAFEIAEQLGTIHADGASSNSNSGFRSPDVVVVPVGDGNIISGLHKGFRDLSALGWIDRIPRIIGVTASKAPALFRAWQGGTEHITAMPSTTLAGGISVDLPRDGVMALRAVRNTGGQLVEADDEEMLDAMGQLARQAAVFVEPASAASLVGLTKARQAGVIQAEDKVVLQLTGSGLKDVQSALAMTSGKVVTIEGRIEEIRRWV